MRKLAVIAALFALIASTAQAQDITGTWQGADRVQHVLKISKAAGGLRGEYYNLGDEQPQGPHNGNTISSIQVAGKDIAFSLDNLPGRFQGKLSQDGKTIAGTWQTMFAAQPLSLTRATKQTAWVIDPSPHKIHFVTVQKGVRLEVLDWGGSGTPLIFLSGLGATAHGFDSFAPRFAGKHHVYAITRRGFGVSSIPPATNENYDADRLGDDVLAVMDALKIEKSVLAGSSVAGEELSSVGTRHPERIAGLVYLDALFQYAFYNPAQADLFIDTATVRRELDQMFEVQQNAEQWRALLKDIQAALPKLQTSMQQTVEEIDLGADPPPLLPVHTPRDEAENKILSNERQYGVVKVPVLAIEALPKQCGTQCDTPYMQQIMAGDAARADLLEKQDPNARVVRLPKANHLIWRSNPADVEREMNAFMDGLKP